jgi:ABC-2 type transport system permease protein
MGMPPSMDVPSQVMGATFNLFSTFILFFIPLLTMGVYAEERKRGTIELLMTSPITELDIVLGKFFGSLTMFATMLIPTAVPVIFLYFCSDPRPPVKIILAGYLGAFLVGASLLAVGTFLSSLTENQIIAAVMTFAVFLIIWLADLLGSPSGSSATLLGYFSIVRHFQDFARGVIDTSSLIYFGSMIVFFVFLTVRSVDSMRWRRA